MFYRALSSSLANLPGSSSGTAAAAKSEVELLKMDVERLLMITEALWTILKDEFGYEDTELTELIKQIDQQDGHLDGRVAPSEPRLCPHCNRTMERKRPICLYCGKAVNPEPFAR